MSRGVGIDIGAEMVKVVQVRAGGRDVEVVGAASFSRHALGVDSSDPNALARAAAARASELGLRGAAFAGISGKDVILRYMSVPPAPLWKLRQLMDYEVSEITGADPREFSYDFRPLNLPQRPTDEFLLLVAVARSQMLEERIAAFAQGRVRLDHFCPDAVALFNVFRRSVEADPKEYVVLLDVGAEKTEVVIMRNQSFIFARSVMPGGREFTEAVAEALDVGAERAEEIKQRRGAIMTPEEIRRHTGQEAEFYDALLAVAGQLVGSVQSTLMFARTQTKLAQLEPARYYLCGGGARLGGLREHLESALGRPVQWLDMGVGVARAEQVAEQPSPYGVALGLAMVAATPGAFALQLLPKRIQRRRHFRRKGVYAYAAVALVPLVVLASLVGTVREWLLSGREAGQAEAAVRAALGDDRRCQEIATHIEDKRRKITLLADKVRANHFVLSTLNALKQQTPEAIILSSLTFDSDRGRSSPTGEEPARFSFRLKGVATKRGSLDASQELDEFVRRLRAAPILAKPLKETRQGTPAGDKVDFQIDFTPSDSLIEERADAAGK